MERKGQHRSKTLPKMMTHCCTRDFCRCWRRGTRYRSRNRDVFNVKSFLLLLPYLAPRLQEQHKSLVQPWVQPLVSSPLHQRCPQRCWTPIGRCPSLIQPSCSSWDASLTLASPSPASSAETHRSAGESHLLGESCSCADPFKDMRNFWYQTSNVQPLLTVSS